MEETDVILHRLNSTWDPYRPPCARNLNLKLKQGFFLWASHYCSRYLSCWCRWIMDFSNFIQDIQRTHSLPKPTFPRVLQIKEVESRGTLTWQRYLSWRWWIRVIYLAHRYLAIQKSQCGCLCVFWTEDYSGNWFRIWGATFRWRKWAIKLRNYARD